MGYDTTKTYRGGFSGLSGSEGLLQEKLRVSLDSATKRFEQLATQLEVDQPDLTRHDIQHIHGLWAVSDQLLGDSDPLNPLETYILGVSFLAHDLGMSVASFPGGKTEILSHPGFRHALAKELRSRVGGPPPLESLDHPSDEQVNFILPGVLRSLHGDQARRIPVQPWQGDSGDLFLISDDDLRTELGHQIGDIASSHGWDIGRVVDEFSMVSGPPAQFPTAWSIDRLRIACLLRAADASQLDGRRAPSFYMAIKKLTGLSLQHWRAQTAIAQPIVENGRFVYSTHHPFAAKDAAAWWVLRDLLLQADHELSTVDEVLVQNSRRSFSVRGVFAVNSVELLAKCIRTEGWVPVDVAIHVSNLKSVVNSLGGTALYGTNRRHVVAIRELIQNGADACRARRSVEEATPSIEVVLGNDEVGNWMEVRDSGCGMSREILTGPLLDFGHSGWLSGSADKVSPGLLESSFAPTGRFGLGFFSIFMIAERVVVTTLPRGAARDDTLVLEFPRGLDERPLLRKATELEKRNEPGSTVRFWTPQPIIEGSTAAAGLKNLSSLLLSMYPTLDVDLNTRVGDRSKKVVKGSDWRTMSKHAFFKRVTSNSEPIPAWLPEPSLLLHNGEVVGRGWLSGLVDTRGVITVGGATSSSYFPLLSGFVEGMPSRAARDQAVPTLLLDDAQSWAQEQLQSIGKDVPEYRQAEAAAIVARLGIPTGQVFVATTSEREWLAYADLVGWLKVRGEFCLAPSAAFEAASARTDYNARPKETYTTKSGRVFTMAFVPSPIVVYADADGPDETIDLGFFPPFVQCPDPPALSSRDWNLGRAGTYARNSDAPFEYPIDSSLVKRAMHDTGLNWKSASIELKLGEDASWGSETSLVSVDVYWASDNVPAVLVNPEAALD